MNDVSALFLSALETARAHIGTPVGRALVAPGASVVWDECCDGQLYIQPLDISLNMSGGCVAGWKIRAALGIIRCVSTVNSRGKSPTETQLTDDAVQGLNDMQDLYCVLLNNVSSIPYIEKLTLDKWEPIGVEGGCAGGEWEFNFTWLGCSCG